MWLENINDDNTPYGLYMYVHTYLHYFYSKPPYEVYKISLVIHQYEKLWKIRSYSELSIEYNINDPMTTGSY